MALALHAHWLHQTLYLWAERGNGFPDAGAARARIAPDSNGAARPRPASAAPHPRALAAIDLRATLGELFADSLLASVAGEAMLQLWLPCDGRGPLASPDVLEDATQAESGERRLERVTVPCLAFSPSQAMDLLTGLPESPSAVGGETLRLSDSVAYWALLARFAAGLLARRQFVPQLEQRESANEGMEYAAAWHVIVADRAELEWLERFAAAMPPACRAAVGAEEEVADAARLVEGFLAAVADAMVRRCVADDDFFRSADRRAAEPFAPPETRWVAALLRADPMIRGSISENSLLAQQVEGWVAQLEPSQAAAMMRLTFRLQEPDEPEEAEETPEQVAAALAAVEESDEEGDVEAGAGPLPAAAPAGSGRPWRLLLALEGPDDQAPPVTTAELWQDGNESAILGRSLKSQRGQFMAELARAAQIFPPAHNLLLQATPSEMHLSTTEAYAFIRQWSPQLREAGFGVTLPEWAYDSTSELGLRLVVRPSDVPGFSATWPEDEPMDGHGNARRPRGGAELTSGRFGLDSLLEFNWQIAVGDLRLSADEFRTLAAAPTPLVKLRGRWVQIDAAAATRAVEFLKKQHEERGGKMTLADALRTAYGASRNDTGLRVLGLEGSSWIEALLEQAPGAKVESLEQPPDFLGTLRPYQLRGLHWLAFLDRLGIGGCLADDMGLGKTIQLIALLLHERLPEKDGKAAPAEKRNSQKKEPYPLLGPTLLFAPTSVVGNWVREIQRFAPHLRVLIHHGPDRLSGDAFAQAAVENDVVITSYALAHRDKEELSRIAWRRIALDEAQKIKNPSAASTIAIRSMVAPRRLAMTGTPIENHLSELWSIMEILNPGLLGPPADFRERFAVPVEKLGDKERAEQLRRLIRPFVLRRLKSDPEIAGDLPEKMESRVFCNLTPEQAALYERVVAESLQQIDAATGIRRRGLILSVLTRLKQICDHPSLLLKEAAAQGGGPPPPLDGRSGKCERLVEMLEEVLEEGDAALIFTQFRQMGHLLERVLADRLRAPTLFLHGGTPAKDRDAMVEKFQSPEGAPKLFILSLRAGGLGLNLTAANHVFHFDRWWNPAVEAQATDRAHRVGQTRQVQVHKFVCIGTMEERIDRLLSEKLALADKIIGSGDDWLTGLSTEQLREYLTLSREAVGEF